MENYEGSFMKQVASHVKVDCALDVLGCQGRCCVVETTRNYRKGRTLHATLRQLTELNEARAQSSRACFHPRWC